MKALVDADMLRYEVGFGVEYRDEEGNCQIKNFDAAVDLLEQKLKEIQEETWADEEPTLYLTGDEKLGAKINKRRVKEGKEPLEFPLNFRIELAKTKTYKGNRSSSKPFHFDNLTTYITSHYDCQIAWGLEADDTISIDHVKDPENTIICTRDKDLRITPGRHFGWACGKQEQFGPTEIDEFGYLELTKKGLKGGGLKFFYSQLITGDNVDNIPGLRGKGPAAAYKLLEGATSESDCYDKVSSLYQETLPEDVWRDYFKEQANLLWIVRELDEEGNPVLYKMYDER